MFKDYNMNQLVLPLDLEVKLQNNDIAFSIHHLVESIPQEVLKPVFGFLKANLHFIQFSVRGKSKVDNEMGLALMTVNLRKFAANS